MNILEKIDDKDFPFKWMNLNSLVQSTGIKKEIYLENQDAVVEELIYMFYFLFKNLKEDIRVYNESWWDYCLDTWDPNKDEYNYNLIGKSDETRKYLALLMDSGIEVGYSGTCACNDWDKFLHTILNCLVNHVAPFSPIFYNIKNNFFFYFHHTASIGIYYEKENSEINRILAAAKLEYNIC
jgi:hypothetical protein